MKVVTVRMPDEVHAALREAAYLTRTSINSVCLGAIEDYLDDLEVAPEQVALIAKMQKLVKPNSAEEEEHASD